MKRDTSSWTDYFCGVQMLWRCIMLSLMNRILGLFSRGRIMD